MNKPAKPSVRSIAASLGLSPITVSRVLSGHPSVGVETRNKVLDEVKKVGYDFFNRSKILKEERNKNVALHCGEDKLWQDRIFGFYSDLYYRCVKRLHAEGFLAHPVDFNEHPESAFDALKKCNGLIVLGPINEAIVTRIRAEHPSLSIISYGGSVNGVIQVGSSDFEGGMIAAEKLYEYGHRRVAAPASLDELIARKRYAGFYTTFIALGGEVDLLRYSEVGDQHRDDEIRERLIDHYLAGPGEKATAFFCHGGYLGLFMMQYFSRRNILVPRDFSLVTYDNFETFDHLTPPLARVWFRTKDLVGQMVETLKNSRNPKTVLPANVEIAPIFTMNASLARCNAVAGK